MSEPRPYLKRHTADCQDWREQRTLRSAATVVRVCQAALTKLVGSHSVLKMRSQGRCRTLHVLHGYYSPGLLPVCVALLQRGLAHRSVRGEYPSQRLLVFKLGRDLAHEYVAGPAQLLD